MIERVLLVAWKGSSATSWVEPLKEGGYTVLLEDTTGERAWRTAKERGIDCVIIDGQKKPSHGRQTGYSLRDTAKTRGIPIIWTNLDIEDAAGVAAEVKPDVTLLAPTSPAEALAALKSLSPNVIPALPGLRDDGEAHGHVPAHAPERESPMRAALAPEPAPAGASTNEAPAPRADSTKGKTKAKASTKTAAKKAAKAPVKKKSR